MSDTAKLIWVFHGAKGRFASAVFSELPAAETWIRKHHLTGVLTAYPLNLGAYDWAVERALFTPKKPEHCGPEFVGGFTSASQEHFHFENGLKEQD